MNGGLKGLRVEGELDVEVGVVVDEVGDDFGSRKLGSLTIFVGLSGLLYFSNGVLAADLSHQSEFAIGQLDVLSVLFKVVTERDSDVLVVNELSFDDVLDVLQDHVNFANRGRLDEVLNDFVLFVAHLYFY